MYSLGNELATFRSNCAFLVQDIDLVPDCQARMTHDRRHCRVDAQLPEAAEESSIELRTKLAVRAYSYSASGRGPPATSEKL